MHAILEEYAGEVEDSLTIAEMDLTQNMEIATDYGVMSTPAMILFKGGETKWEHFGLMAKDKIKSAVEKALS